MNAIVVWREKEDAENWMNCVNKVMMVLVIVIKINIKIINKIIIMIHLLPIITIIIIHLKKLIVKKKR